MQQTDKRGNGKTTQRGPVEIMAVEMVIIRHRKVGVTRCILSETRDNDALEEEESIYEPTQHV